MNLVYLEKNELVACDAGNVSFDRVCDILVIGVGAAGSHTAIAAAREGADVIAIEREENIGGMPINGLVKGYYYGARGGSFEVLDKASRHKNSVFLSRADGPDMRRIVLLEALDKYGVKLICGCIFDGVYFEGERVVGVTVFNNGVRENIRAKTVIDATSDGHVIRMCPVKTEHGRPSDGKTVPFSMRAELQRELEGSDYDNSDSGQGDPYDVPEFSKKIIIARGTKSRFLKTERRLVSMSTVCGIREGVRFEGEDRLTYADMILDKRPEKVLFYAYSDLDKHGHDLAIDDELYQNWWVISNLSTVTINIPVPMGVVVPKGIKGLVTAGRCISVDSYASSAVRMNRDMFRMGECVGIASAMAVAKNCDFTDIDYEEYLSKVRKYDCFDGEKEKRFGFHFTGNNRPYTPIDPHMGEEDIISGLSTDCPGAAIWASFINGGEALAKRLVCEMNSENLLLKYNSAIALGIMGRREGLPLLRELVKKRKNFSFKDCRRTNQLRSVIAICLLGRLGDETDITLLEDIIFNDGEFEKTIYDLSPEQFSDRFGTKMVLFQHYTHAVMSYVKLSKRFGIDNYGKLLTRFSGSEREKVIRAITREPETAYIYAEISDFLDNALKAAK